ncbi:MAG: peptidoglycan DD-metalloendopeptidase family protein [Legionellales bacterium]|nr:peptidoglycan DD-metalloendopeptidase family protein [Legionellales bacterium]
MRKSKWIFFILTVMITQSIFSTSFADTRQTKLNEYQHVTQQLQGLQSSLQHSLSAREKLTQDLQQTELAIGTMAKNLDKIDEEINDAKNTLQTLTAQKQTYLQQLHHQDQSLNQQLRAAYLLSRENPIKMVLNQEDPQKISLMLTYYHYFSRARLTLIAQLKDTLAHLAQNQQRINQQTQKLTQILQKRQREQEQLTYQKNLRSQVLSQLNKDIAGKQQRINQLEVNKQALAELLSRLTRQHQVAQQRAVQEKKVDLAQYLHIGKLKFMQMQGKLPWPTSGSILQSFGATLGANSVKLNAVILNANEGQAVRAVYPGKVIFANWLRGFGLLIILDHGNGYMTMYGRNESLFSKVGEVVQAGQLIARVGKSGGYDESGLYFAIRHNGNPLDPARWCQRQR